ncbi:ribonucleoside-diphosphate reductase subunit alpha [bacterium]|nr:ribonucleoside-diphosphate reductase subunit alpha [bacterium]
MKVQKRNGSYENVSFDKIQARLLTLCQEPNLKPLNIDPTIVAQKVCSEIYDGVTTEELDILSSEISISLYSKNVDYKHLASRIVVSNHHKNTSGTFGDIVDRLHNYKKNGKGEPLINDDFYNLVQNNLELIENNIDYVRDYKFDYFGYKTLERSYLLKIDGKIVERPQDMLMRVSLSIHRNDLDKAFETYEHMSRGDFIHATPTLFNAGTNKEQFSSCFLLAMQDDSVQGIFDTLTDCAKISKHAGGIGLSIHNIRAKDSFIAGTNGISNGIVPMLRVFNDTARYIDQGGGKRNGSFAIYLEPWHADIFDFLELKKNHGNELERARDLFYGLWITDLFMERVKCNGKWSLFCPDKCPGLHEVYGIEFNKLYTKYEDEGRYNRQVNAQELWFAILTSQIETGTPYLTYKDAANMKSNQKNLGTIKSSNLCTEIIEYTDKDETAVCNLASISLKNILKYRDTNNIKLKIYTKSGCMYCDAAKRLCDSKGVEYIVDSYENLVLGEVKPHGVKFPQIYIVDGFDIINTHIGGYTELEQYLKPNIDYDSLRNTTRILVRNLNNIIDYNYYPTERTERSNMKHRPIGIGVQGLANLFYEMKCSFDSDEAKMYNEKIFECIYYAALDESCELAKIRESMMLEYKSLCQEYDLNKNDELYDKIKNLKNILNPIDEEVFRDEYLGSYSSFIGSPVYNGELQFDMWHNEVGNNEVGNNEVESETKQNNSLNDWTLLRNKIKMYGIRNSLLLAPMPTASTSQILGNYECFEPVMSNIYTRRVLSGEYMVLNDYLVKDLRIFDMWNDSMKDMLIKNDGSIQKIEGIPQMIKDRYKTAWELKQKHIIDMAADRGKYICQSQSLNLFMEAPNFSKLSSMHFYAWQKGLKTGIYYLRSRPSSKAIQFTIAPETCENCSA